MAAVKALRPLLYRTGAKMLGAIAYLVIIESKGEGRL